MTLQTIAEQFSAAGVPVFQVALVDPLGAPALGSDQGQLLADRGGLLQPPRRLITLVGLLGGLQGIVIDQVELLAQPGFG